MMVYLTSDSHFNSCYKYLKILGVKESSFIRFTQETVFERCLLEQLTYEIVYKHSSFEAFANAHNTLYSGMSFRAKQFIITFVPIAQRIRLQFWYQVNQILNLVGMKFFDADASNRPAGALTWQGPHTGQPKQVNWIQPYILTHKFTG